MNYETVQNNVWTPFSILNGIVNATDNPRNTLKIMNNRKELYNENKLNTISRNINKTCVSNVYFSKDNIENLHKGIINNVYNKSKGSYKIRKQSGDELTIVMRSIYFQHSKNNPNNVLEQVRELNKYVIDWCTDEIITNIKQYDSYKQSISTLPMPLEHSQLSTQKGTRTLEIKSFI
jgi:hypothetical protein